MIRRRLFLGSAAAALAAPAMGETLGQTFDQTTAPGATAARDSVKRNVTGFQSHLWEDHFETLDRVSILCDTRSRALHYWHPDGTYALYPTSVPQTDELTRRGDTEVVRKKVGPSWTPTASMRQRDPSLPEFMPPGPDNPLGTHAMYLGWPAYLIHGTHDSRKIGRRSSSGCIGLYNEMIAELFAKTPVGSRVRVI
ncbi:MAG: L,D-transpeptidase family protein [Pseudomonadota bacterium]